MRGAGGGGVGAVPVCRARCAAVVAEAGRRQRTGRQCTVRGAGRAGPGRGGGGEDVM